jgi:DNA-binding CsgD family transcriptional regulator
MAQPDGQDPEELERLAQVSCEAGDYAAAVRLRERAFAAWRGRGELRRPAFLAGYHLAFDHAALFGDDAVAQGWLERAIHLVEEAGDCPEAGWVALSRVLATPDPGRRTVLLREAAAVAERFGDRDLAFDALAYDGLAHVEAGDVDGGMRRLDEAAAASRGGEVRSRATVGEIYCKMLVACELTLDVRRARQWRVVTDRLADEPPVAWASAICRAHHGGILLAAGRWEEAESELSTSLRLYDATYRALRSAAVVRLADLRARQGRFPEAEALLREAPHDPWSVRARARVHLGRGEGATAVAVLQRHLADQPGSIGLVPVRALLVEALLAAGRADEARSASAALDGVLPAGVVPSLRGFVDHAGGRVAASPEVAVERLQGAVVSFSRTGLPLEEARARLALAELQAEDEPELAAAEATAAVQVLRGLGAAPDVDVAAALLRQLGRRVGSGRRGEPLSRREQEVLALLAQGLSNTEIAARLVISPRTAGHHVSHLLVKLDLPNRAAAAAWAAARGRDLAR